METLIERIDKTLAGYAKTKSYMVKIKNLNTKEKEAVCTTKKDLIAYLDREINPIEKKSNDKYEITISLLDSWIEISN